MGVGPCEESDELLSIVSLSSDEAEDKEQPQTKERESGLTICSKWHERGCRAVNVADMKVAEDRRVSDVDSTDTPVLHGCR